MDTNEKFSDLLQLMSNKIHIIYHKEESVLSFMVRVFRCIEKDKLLSSILTFENADVLMEQFLFLKIGDVEKVRSVHRDAMYLLKSNLLFINMERQRKKKSCFFL